MNLNPIVSAPVGPSSTKTDSGKASPRLQSAAHEFEAALLAELLKPMRERAEFSSSQGEDDSDSDGSMREFGTEAMAQALSEHGGLGIAKLVLAKLAPLEAEKQQKNEGDSGTGPAAN